MAPVTLPAALAQQNAEALACIVLTQMVRPGTPVIYGGFTSNVDMRSGAPAFGTPENTKAAFAGGQLARRYGLPYRSSNATDEFIARRERRRGSRIRHVDRRPRCAGRAGRRRLGGHAYVGDT